MIDMTKPCPGCNRKALDRFGVHLYHCAKHVSAPIRNGFHAMLKSSVVNALEAPLRTLNLRVCEREPHMIDYYDPVRQLTQTESQETENEEADLGEDSRADLVFKGGEGTKPILVDVTSTSGLSKNVNLAQYRPGSAAQYAEERKEKAYLRKWNIRDASRASLTFFAIELTGCLGPEAQRLCTQLADLTGEGPEGRKRVNELISIGFQTNRAMRMSFMMREVRRGGLGLGSRMVTGMD
jgi:hypothetical protein